jgi:hypothetical protein
VILIQVPLSSCNGNTGQEPPSENPPGEGKGGGWRRRWGRQRTAAASVDRGVVSSLPADGETMTTEEAADWLQAAAYNLQFAYKFQGRIKVTVEGQGEIPIRGGGDAS